MDDIRTANHLPGRIPHRRNRHRGRKSFAVFPDLHGFVTVNPISSPQSAQDLLFFRMQLRRNEPTNRLGDNLVRAVSKHTGSSSVPADNPSIQILADDGIIGVLYDRSEVVPRVDLDL